MNKIILFLIRKKLKLKIYEKFQFENQLSKNDYYYFDKYNLMKKEYSPIKNGYKTSKKSSCSLNWLLNKNCRIKKVGTKL